MKKIFAIYPPGKKIQRSEERCQASIEDSPTITQRASNDLGYVCSISRKLGFEAYLRDYPSESKTYESLNEDLNAIKPDIVFISSTNGSIIDDSEIFDLIKRNNSKIVIIAKGAVFTTLKEADLKIINNYIKNLDYAVTGEFEAVLEKLLNHFKSSEEIAGTNGIMYKKDNKWILPDKPALIENLDSIPFPARDLMNNKLYVRPDNNRPMATIESAKGCPANCVYCLTPVISGKKVRFRSPENIIEELKECVRKYGIYDFFFRADTFTINKEWVIKLCSLILKEQMEISWIANSRVKPLDLETVEIMKKAGCRLIALGIESASNYTLSRLKKGITADEIINAVSIIKKCGVECYGFFMIGFPWEKRDDILKTINFAIDLNLDYAEFHIVTAFNGTELFKEYGGKENSFGGNYFSKPTNISGYLSTEELLKLRKYAIRKFYIRPKYIANRISGIKNFYHLTAMIRYGMKILFYVIKKR